MSSSINDFKSVILRNKGFARPNRFEIEISNVPGWSGNTRDLKFLCETVNLPGKQITTLDYDIGTRRPLKIPTGYIEDDVTMVFNLTNNYAVKVALDKWMEQIINVNTYLLSYDTSYKRDISITQLNEKNGQVYTAQLRNAYPITVNSIDLDSNSESTVQKVTVVFTYDTLKINPTFGGTTDFIGDINTSKNSNVG
jgi:hypothetical protein